MKVQYRLKMGQEEFLLEVDVANAVEFFEKLSFYSGLPKVGPNGEDDLKITHRTTTQGYNYYSLVSEKAKMEYKFGQPKEDPKSLYGKGWEPLHQAEGTQQAPIQQRAAAPIQQQTFIAPQVQQQATVNPQFPGMVAPHVGPTAAMPQPQTFVAPTPAPVQPAAPVAPANPAVAAAANNVLARFGIPAK